MINLLLIGNETLLQTQTHDDYYFYGTKIKQRRGLSISLYFTMAYNNYLQFNGDWCEILNNIFTILVTNFTNLIKQNRIKLLAKDLQYVEYFAIIFPSELKNNADLKICVAERTLVADLSKTICQNLDANERTVVEFIKSIYSQYWYYIPHILNGEAEIDPFDRFSDKSIDLYIFNLAFQRENKNVTIYTWLALPGGFPWTFPTIYREVFDHKYRLQYYIFVQSTGLNWLTCYEQTYIGFGFYLSPFQLDLWIGFGITMVSVIGVCWIYTKFFFKDSTTMSFSPWLFVLGTIFEETSSAPAKLEKRTFYRLSIGIWCLMVAILTNCYNSLMITGLNSPLPGSKIESFKDLLCDKSLFDAKPDFNFTLWIQTSKISQYWAWIYRVNFGKDTNISVINPYESRNCFRIWSPELQVFRSKVPSNSLFVDFWDRYMKLEPRILYFDSWSYSEKILTSFLHPGHAREPEMITKIRNKEKRLPTSSELNTANQLKIRNCPQKSAYIGQSKEIAMQLDFLSRNYNRKKFYLGKDLIDEKFEGLAFWKVRNTKIPGYYRLLIDTGIYERLMVENRFRWRGNRFRKPVEMKENLRLEGVSSLEGGLVTLFILCGAGVGVTVIAFCFECRRMILERLIAIRKKVLKAFKTLSRKRKFVKFRRHRKIHVEIDMIEVKPK
jgi:hypothetical protein